MTLKVETFTVAAGATEIYPMAHINMPLGVSVAPVSGGTAKVEISRTPTAVGNQAGAKWINSSLGNMTADTEGTIYGPCVALRLSATTQAATFELVSQA